LYELDSAAELNGLKNYSCECQKGQQWLCFKLGFGAVSMFNINLKNISLADWLKIIFPVRNHSPDRYVQAKKTFAIK